MTFLKRRQSGFALLMLLVVLMGITSVALSNLLSSSVPNKHLRDKQENIRVLAEAKEALLSYAVEYVLAGGGLDEMGQLPCPDANPGINGEGQSDPNCGVTSANTLGYFPFKTLGIGKIEDAANECLWYIVSGDYKTAPPSDLLNWDTVGYLRLYDEDANLKHANSREDFPIAFIISPGATINQDRTPHAALPTCGANFIPARYLEDGPNLNYANNLPNSDTLWDVLTSSVQAAEENVDYNDQVVAIYKDELWDRVRALGDLEIDNAPFVAATTPIERLTQSLAECIAAYGNDNIQNPNDLLPYPAPLDISPLNTLQNEYRFNDRYDDVATRHGRFPQRVNHPSSPFAADPFVFGGGNYCQGAAGVSAYNEGFWANWKDHFFYVVSQDFDPQSATAPGAARCGGGTCVTIDGKPNKLAAIVIFAGSKDEALNQNRNWWWDPNALPAPQATDNKADPANYLEGGNETVYTAGTQDFSTAPVADYLYCIEYDDIALTFTALKCTDVI